jgi:acyl carrier protein
MSDLTEEIKRNIAQELKLSGEFDYVQPDTPLFSNPHISLDSIDAVVIVVMLQKSYGIKMQDLLQARKVLFSLETIAEYVEKNRLPQP